MKKNRSANQAPPRMAEAAPTEPQIVRANVNRQEVTSPTFVSIYANDISVQVSPWDVRLILGEIFQGPSDENPNVIVRQLGEVRVSPQLAKRVVSILIEQLRGYENRFGPIPQPD